MPKAYRNLTKAIYYVKNLFKTLYNTHQRASREIAPYFQHDAPYVLSHRGGMFERPEHTQLAFDHSQKLGLTGFEIDIRLSKDAQVIVFHDRDVNRTTNGSGCVSQHTLNELLRLDAGYHFKDDNGQHVYRGHPHAKIMTLDTLLERYPNQRINIDIKDDPESYLGTIAAERLYQVIKKYKAQHRVLVTSFHKKQIERFNCYNHNEIATGASQAEVTEGIIKLFLGVPFLYKGQAHTFQMPLTYKRLSLVSPRLISWLNARHIVPGYYGVNRLELMRDLTDKGVHTIVTDKPSLAKQFLSIKNDIR